jgi:putative transposase
MGDLGHQIRRQTLPHFITFAVVGWVDVFTKNLYRNIVLDSIRFCQKEKGMDLNAWCLMSNHIHLIASSKFANLSGLLRDFKKFTSKQILSAIEDNKDDRRREWMLDIFSKRGNYNTRNEKFQFWQQDNHPLELFGAKFIFQKLNYIHINPVTAGIVAMPEHYLFSSAKDYALKEQCGLLDISWI